MDNARCFYSIDFFFTSSRSCLNSTVCGEIEDTSCERRGGSQRLGNFWGSIVRFCTTCEAALLTAPRPYDMPYSYSNSHSRSRLFSSDGLGLGELIDSSLLNLDRKPEGPFAILC
jgi:hypothetical protein